MDYKEFLKTKLEYGKSESMESVQINKMLFDFQRDIVTWACKKGRAAIFADTGLGKTFMQLEFAKNANKNTSGKTIIFAPLSVNEQTIQEAKKLNLEVTRYNINDDIDIKICNYENIDKINPDDYKAVVLDESSILKSVDSVTRKKIIEFSVNIKYRLACTATPAPNDISEIANHTEFLGIMKREEMLSKFFYNDGSDWRIKGHGIEAFYRWMATWGMFIKYPSDLGYKDDGFKLPKLNFEGRYFDYEFKKEDTLFDMGFSGIEDRMKIRKDTIKTKIEMIQKEVNANNEQSIIWCGLNQEAEQLYSVIENSVNLKGDDSDDDKIDKIKRFKSGDIKVLITKPKIAGFGLNFQNCHNVHFFGLSDSYESYYQCIRRCYRFGQKKPVNVYIWLAGNEKLVLENVKQKEIVAEQVSRSVIKYVKNYEQEEIKGQKHQKDTYMTKKEKTENYEIYQGDSCEVLKELPSNSVDFMVFSPPFASLYTYSPSERDLGNCQDDKEFFIHFEFIIKELERIIKPGRNIAVHCMNLPTKIISHGYIGIRDFRGDIIRAFERNNMIYHAEVCIQKNPQAAAIRTHAKGLMFKQMHKDSSWSRMGLADYICVFRKKGENEKPIVSDLTNDEWIKYAHPIWTDIRETHTLNSRESKSEKDEKHICPLQLDVIERCIRLWSNKGEVVLSPFAGIGSEGYIAIKHNRKFIGVELKPEYFTTMINNLTKAESLNKDLFSIS